MKLTHIAIFFTILMAVLSEVNPNENPSLLDDLLQPYKVQHGSTKSNRHTRQIPSPRYNYTYEISPANTTDVLVPTSTTRYFVSDVPRYDFASYNTITAYGHMTTVTNPLKSFSVLEPRESGGCSSNITETVAKTAKQRNCIVAQNGGFFNTTSGSCLGNIVSDGRMVQDSSAIQNVNFGITKNGSIVVGYLAERDIELLDFQQLIGGAIWLVRNGESYVEDAFKCESSEVEETGTLRTFIDVQSARTALGHDSHGRVVLVHVEGQTRVRGVNLDEFARLLIKEFHLVNAINLDGGGSATLVLNGSLSNYPSDHCRSDPEWRCARAISTVICVHEPDCVPECIHGECVNGRCACEGNYRQETCDELYCGKRNCSGHGVCHPEGCDCLPGWNGLDCTIPCMLGWFGKNCSQECRCQNNGSCDATTGVCDCLPGFGGATCERGCGIGRYGRNCEFQCHCASTCSCDPVTGVCGNYTNLQSQKEEAIFQVAQCMVKKSVSEITQNLSNKEEENFQWVAALCTVIGLLALSLVCNVYLLLVKSDCWGDFGYHGRGSKVTDDYIPLQDVTHDNKEQSPRRKTKPFSMKSKKRTRLKSRMPSWGKLMTKFQNSSKKASRDGYTQLVLPESNIEFEETSLLAQFR